MVKFSLQICKSVANRSNGLQIGATMIATTISIHQIVTFAINKHCHMIGLIFTIIMLQLIEEKHAQSLGICTSDLQNKLFKKTYGEEVV